LSGLTQPAKDRAAGSHSPKIALGDLLTTAEHVEPDLGVLFSGFGDCPNDNCLLGDIHWTWWESSSGARLKAGLCDSCAAFAVECPECGEINLDEGTCFSCETKFELGWDREGLEVESVEVEVEGKTTSYAATGEPARAPRDSPEL